MLRAATWLFINNFNGVFVRQKWQRTFDTQAADAIMSSFERAIFV